jgi:hypothetical protein
MSLHSYTQTSLCFSLLMMSVKGSSNNYQIENISFGLIRDTHDDTNDFPDSIHACTLTITSLMWFLVFLICVVTILPLINVALFCL